MRKLKFEIFSGFSKEEKPTDFINDNNIKQEDILKIVYKSISGDFSLLYYSNEEQ